MDANQILLLAETYAASEELTLAGASWRIFGDTKKLAAIKDGGDLYTGRAKKAAQWLSDNWPPSAVWPAEIPRPSPSEEAA